MQTIRHAEDRGTVDLGWLQSQHSFSFGHYHDPAHMGFGPLRVINEDRVAPKSGFDTHGHQDMEIISYVLSGALEHKDSMGNGSIIRPGDVQRMSAGTGVRHSEFNHSDSQEVHFLQIWITPETKGIAPGYEQKHFPVVDRQGNLKLIGSRDGRDDSVTIHRDVDLFSVILNAEQSAQHSLAPHRKGWLQVARGSVSINGERTSGGDGIALEGGQDVTIFASSEAEVLVFDMA